MNRAWWRLNPVDVAAWLTYARWLRSRGYENPARLDQTRWCAVRADFRGADIIAGLIGDDATQTGAWHYPTRTDAIRAQERWWHDGGDAPDINWPSALEQVTA